MLIQFHNLFSVSVLHSMALFFMMMSLATLSFQDLKTKTVSFVAVCFFMVSALIMVIYQVMDLGFYEMIARLIVMVVVMAAVYATTRIIEYRYRVGIDDLMPGSQKYSIVGRVDLLVLSLLMLSIESHMIPWFIITLGGFLCGAHILLSAIIKCRNIQVSLPMMPFIMFAYIVIKII